MTEQSYNVTSKSLNKQAIFSMLLGSTLIGIGPFFVEFSTVSAETNTFYRLLVGAIFFMGFSLWKKELKMDFPFLGPSILAGGLLVLDLFLWNQSVLYIGAGLSTVLSNIEIVFLVLLGRVVFSEKMPHHFVIQCGCITIGISALLFPVFPTLTFISSMGILFALSASFSYALYLFAIKYISKKFPRQTSTAMLAVACLAGCILLGTIIWSRDVKTFFIPSWHSFFCIFINSVLSQVIGWWFISRGIIHLSLSLSGLLLLLQPALTFMIDSLFFGRNTHWLQIVGSLCLFSSIYLATKKQQVQKEST